MPCENCAASFTVFKRKRACQSCHRLYCSNCLAKESKKIFCLRCSIFRSKPAPSKEILMDLKTKDLIFYLQSKKINIEGICEKDELANLIINHVNLANYEAAGNQSSSSTPNNDFENYAQSFDQIKQTCQSLFNSISDKIATDFQKTTCFNQQQSQNRPPTTTQPRPSNDAARSNTATPSASHDFASQRQEGSSSATRASANLPSPSSSNPSRSQTTRQTHCAVDCACSDDEMDEISEKRQSIFEGNPGPSGFSSSRVKLKVSNSTSTDSSSFEELETNTGKAVDDNWQFIENTSSNGIELVENPPLQLSIDDVTASPSLSQEHSMTKSMVPDAPANPEVRKLTRRRSDSSLLSLRKSNSITIDSSAFEASQSGSEVKKLKISCNKCGKAKSNIKKEILKLSEQLRMSNKSETEVKAKIKEFLDYLESKSQPSEMTETEDSQLLTNQHDENLEGARSIQPSTSHDEIEENIFDENEGINVYPSIPYEQEHETASQSSTSTPRRFIQLDDINSCDELESLSVKQLKEILMLNRVDFKGCCEKQELKDRVERLWQDHVASLPSDKLPSDDLCKICMDAAIECVFLECGHTATCVSCGKVLNECPICRQFIVRIVRIFKS